MKLLLTTAIFIALLIPPAAFAVNRVSYKCYLETSKGHEVTFYRWKDENIVGKIAALTASKKTDSKGKSYYIKKAVECVPQSEDFASKAAKKLDKQTLR